MKEAVCDTLDQLFLPEINLIVDEHSIVQPKIECLGSLPNEGRRLAEGGRRSNRMKPCEFIEDVQREVLIPNRKKPAGRRELHECSGLAGRVDSEVEYVVNHRGCGLEWKEQK